MFSKHNIAKLVIYLVYPILRIVFRSTIRKHLTIFLFHEVTDSPSRFQSHCMNYTSTANFERCIKWISKNYEVIDVKNISTLKSASTKPLAMITFDDAWQGQLAALVKVSNDFDLPVTFFTNFGTIETGIDNAAFESYEQESDAKIVLSHKILNSDFEFQSWQGGILSKNEFEQLSRLSNITISNHGYMHYCSSELTKEDFLENVSSNERAISQFNPSNRFFAFPFGRPEKDFTISQVRLLLDLNYEYLFAADSRLNTIPLNGSKLLSRVHFSPNDSKSSDFWWAVNKKIIFKRS